MSNIFSTFAKESNKNLNMTNPRLNYILSLFGLLFLSASSLFAQSGKLFNTDTQLSSSFAIQVLEDHEGFIWVATRNGLNVYDGYNFTVFSKEAKDNQGFSNNYVNRLGEDSRGNIIVGTNNGIMIYDGKRFKSLPMMKNGEKTKSYINDILTRKNGEVWICTSGYGVMRINKDYTQCDAIQGVLAPYTYIYAAMEDKQGRVWFITEAFELLRLEKNGKLTRHFGGIDNVKAKRIIEDKQGNIFLGTEHHGVYVMKSGTTTFSHIEGINTPSIETLCVCRNNILYIGSNGDGITSYDLKTGTVIDDPFFSNQVNLDKAKVTSIIEDKQGNIWATMLQKGVYMQPNKNYDFGYMGYKLGVNNRIGENCVTSITKSKDGRIWVGTDKDYLYVLSKNIPMSSIHYTNVPSTILALCQDKKGNIWLGSYREGFGYLDPAGTFHPVNLGLGGTLSVFDIKSDPQGNLWLATMGNGLVCLRADGTVKNYTMQKGSDSNHKANSIPNDYLAKLAFNKDYSKLYIASSVGLCCLDVKTGNWVSTFGKNLLNNGSFSHCVFCDSRGNIWYGTEDGVYVYSAKDYSHPKIYTTENGLCNNSISFISEDAKGRIWIGTTHGLNILNPQTGSIKIYYVENGLQSNEFSDGAVFAEGNNMLMAGTGGINWVNTLAIKQHKWDAKVIISRFVAGNISVYPGMESGWYTITEKPVYDTDLFELSHEDNTFSLQLSTLTYNNVEQISYAYSINGDEWHTIQAGQNEISFSHLSPGTYKFQVKAIINGQESSISEFTIDIHPAWYASFWARFFYFLVILGLIRYYMQHRKRQEKDRLLLQEHIHSEEMGEAKLKFFMNISHEIRTPLTLILTPLLTLIKEDKDIHRQGIYDLMRKNSERILHLVNQMMDLRKIDKGQMVMHMCETDMVAFVNDEYKLFAQQAEYKKITFRYEHADESLPVWIDRDNFDKVLMNVLSNAFKFTPTGGRITITLSHSPHHVRIAVKDSGKGIEAGKLETIFQRFYQSPTQATDRNVGTGIGLDLTRSLVELHYGTIVASNNRDKGDANWLEGSEFLITLPLGKDHLKPEEIIEIAEETQSKEDIQELNVEEESEKTLSPQEEQIEEETSNGTAKSKIAIVEDDDSIREYLAVQLGDMFQTFTYRDGKEALPEIIKTQPDLVISDIMMPEMDGNTLCAKLKGNVNTNHIPVILLTAMSREEDKLDGLQTGADAYITKPFNMEILRRTIINLLSVRQTLRNKFNGNESMESKLDTQDVQSPNDALMDRIMQVINENLMNEDLSVELIANKVGISRVHLHRKMKELTNQTPHSFIRNIRLQRAAKLLRESRKSVTEVMYVCGFSNPASFSTMFKNLYGCSPRDYMNQHHGES